MINFTFFNQIFVILISIICFYLVFWVYFTDRKSKINQLFFWLGTFLFLWIILCYFGNTSTDLNTALFLGKLAYGVVALFFIPFYFFILNFLKEETKFPVLNKLTLLSSLFLFFLSVFTNSMVINMEFTKFGAIPVLGKGKFIYLC